MFDTICNISTVHLQHLYPVASALSVILAVILALHNMIQMVSTMKFNKNRWHSADIVPGVFRVKQEIMQTSAAFKSLVASGSS